MQTWILIIGGLVVLGIGLDLLRRMRNASRHSQEMDFDMQQGLAREEAAPPVAPAARDRRDPDFPNGGARKVDRSSSESAQAPPKKVEPRIKTAAPLEDTQRIRRSPTLPANLAQQKPAEDTRPAQEKAAEADAPIPMLMDADERAEATFLSEDDPFMSGRSPILSKPRVVPRKSGSEPPPEEGPSEVIVINVMARQPEGLTGAQLLETVLSCGLRYGEMNIFHYHLSDADDAILFSMANILKPGVFDLNSMQSFQTPGVSFFMRLPLRAGNKVSAMETFEKMLACAKKVAQQLNGELRDERRSVMTGQTVEHCRQRISEFSRLTLSRSGKYTSH